MKALIAKSYLTKKYFSKQLKFRLLIYMKISNDHLSAIIPLLIERIENEDYSACKNDGVNEIAGLINVYDKSIDNE